MNENYQGLIKSVIVPAFISGIVSAVVSFGTYAYQSHEEYIKNQKPIMDLDDWTEKDTSYDSPLKNIHFQLSIRNVTISNISLIVEEKEKLGEIFQLSIADGRGGGFDTANINIASVELESSKDQYQLYDLKSHKNLFRKETTPFIVNSQGNITNEFFKIFLRENRESIIYGVKINIEWKENKNSDEEKTLIKSTNTHHYTFINSKQIHSLINQYPETIIANNLNEYQKIINEYFSNIKRPVYIEYKNEGTERYLIFTNGAKVELLDNYSSSVELHFRLINKANKVINSGS